MADLKMNEFATVTFVSKVVGVDGSGNNRLISPNDLIQVGSERGRVSDLNNAKKSGLYVADFETENTPVNDYGVVEVLNINVYIIQKFFGLNQNSIYYRRSINSGSSFESWIKIK